MTQFEALARRAEKAKQKLVDAANDVAYQTVLDARAWVIYFSSGTATSLQQAALNNPYGLGLVGPKGTRGPVPYGDLSIINAQTGKFRDDWMVYVAVRGIGAASGILTWGIKNVNPIASFLQFGTVKMKARPLDKGLRAYMDQVYSKRLGDAVRPVMETLYV